MHLITALIAAISLFVASSCKEINEYSIRKQQVDSIYQSICDKEKEG